MGGEMQRERVEMADDDGPGVSFRRGFTIDPLNFSLLLSRPHLSSTSAFSASYLLVPSPPSFPSFLPQRELTPRDSAVSSFRW